MGAGRFTVEAYARLRVDKGYDSKSRDEIFVARHLDPEMDPRQITVRESRDSAEHPESLAIIVALDVTGSMGFVPEAIVKNTLPDLVGTIIEAGLADPQVLFLGIGDHVHDAAPLQVGQFESSAELLDRWLTRVYLEGGGGGNGGESYHMAYLFAARHTAIDCWEKRRQKGFLFTIGDEPCLERLPAESIQRFTSAAKSATVTAAKLLEEASQRYHIYHLHVNHGGQYDNSAQVFNSWRDLLGERFVVIDDYTQVCKKIATLVVEATKAARRPGATRKPGSHGAKGGTDVAVEDML
jgi:hypothetical protein